MNGHDDGCRMDQKGIRSLGRAKSDQCTRESKGRSNEVSKQNRFIGNIHDKSNSHLSCR